MSIPVISGVIELAKMGVDGIVGHFKDKAAIKKAKVEGEIQVIKQAAQNTADWEMVQAKNSGGSWKDEYWTVILSIPAILVFIPDMVPHVRAGFEVLATMPEWYQYTLMAAILASFGIRVTNFFKK
jgi:hypothetical protein